MNMPVQHMTIPETLRELQRFHDEARRNALEPNGHVTRAATYHAYLSDAAARAAADYEYRSRAEPDRIGPVRPKPERMK